MKDSRLVSAEHKKGVRGKERRKALLCNLQSFPTPRRLFADEPIMEDPLGKCYPLISKGNKGTLIHGHEATMADARRYRVLLQINVGI